MFTETAGRSQQDMGILLHSPHPGSIKFIPVPWLQEWRTPREQIRKTSKRYRFPEGAHVTMRNRAET
jgi:hypothetical protein